MSATTATTPSIVTIDSGDNNDDDKTGGDGDGDAGADDFALGVLEHESHGPVRPTLTRVVPHTAHANKGLSNNSYGSHGIATLMSGAIPLTCHLRVIRVIRPVIRCK